MGPFVGVAAAFFAIGVLSFLLEIQSPSYPMFYGVKVHGYTQAGVTYYSYHGNQHVIDNRFAAASDTSRRPTTVYLSHGDPDDESKAYIYNRVTWWIDFWTTAGWFIVGFAFIAAGLIRAQVRLRRRVTSMGLAGSGISDEAVRRYLERQRAADG